MSKYGSSFAESEAILAITADDEPYAESLIEKMSDGEIKMLYRACMTLGSCCTEEINQRGYDRMHSKEADNV